MMVIGHSATYSRLQEQFERGVLHSGLLLCGPKGIGKATLARTFAKSILLPSEEEGVAGADQRFDAGSHAGFLYIAREMDHKKGELKSDITAEQVREINSFLSLTPGEGEWRVVVIDAMDELNVTAANAILKILEEPPAQTVFMLVVHQPGRLLPTIRSRCQMVALSPLSMKDYSRIMRKQLPDVSDDSIIALGSLVEYSPGLALEMHEQGALGLYEQLTELWECLPDLPHVQILSIANWVGGGAGATPRFQLFSRLVMHLLAVSAKSAVRLPEQDMWAQQWQAASEMFNAAEKLHLDYSAVIISFFHALANQQPFALSA